MTINIAQIRKLLKDFNFNTLFIEELGWDRHNTSIEVNYDGTKILYAIAQKRGLVVYHYKALDGEKLPDYSSRRKIEQQVAKTTHEHLIIFTDSSNTNQIWQWVKREPGKPAACREHHFYKGQSGEALSQKLQLIAFTLEEEDTLTLTDVTSRARQGFDIESVTRRFFDRFKTEHEAFLDFITGITEPADHEWYGSVMLNRLMFIYFIQRKGFLDGDQNYLRARLNRVKSEHGQDRFYSFYRYFLLRLFHEGLGDKRRSHELETLLGRIPYLNGGLFELHDIEKKYPDIQLPDEAFERIFDYFDQYQWHLDERPLRADNEINPDVLGYIFEKYINQKQMGAYYTKEDITEYISKNTVLPFLFEGAKSHCTIAFENQKGPTIWNLLQSNPERYVYPAVKHGVISSDGSLVTEHELPDFVQHGMANPNVRMLDSRYNLQQASPEDQIRLVTETWREYVDRRNRCLEMLKKMHGGEIREINELITLNLDIRQFAQDVIDNCEGPELLRAFWNTIEKVTVLDPTCGSGAFLFAALNILESLYEACLNRMESFLDDYNRIGDKSSPEKYTDFKAILERMALHPNRRYFILKSIILNNLYGVDIMEEAVEICRLRLFLKLAAQIEPELSKDNLGVEPLPDIDFNIRAGNTLVGYVSLKEVRSAMASKLDLDDAMVRFTAAAENVDKSYKQFRKLQTGEQVNTMEVAKAKTELQKQLTSLSSELDKNLAVEYEINARKATDYNEWLGSHMPFHWLVEFYGIMNQGGFDVIIGNPPYVELKNVKDYEIRKFKTKECGDLYALVMERSKNLLCNVGRIGMIIPISIGSTDGFENLRGLFTNLNTRWCLNFAERPSKLFTGVEKRLSIWIIGPKTADESLWLSNYRRWFSEERDNLFSTSFYVGKNDTMDLVNTSIPKVAKSIEIQILKKLSRQERLNIFFEDESKNIIYYTRKVRYFVQFFDFIPEILDHRKKRVEPSELKMLYLANPKHRDVALAVLNSNLFYWFYSVYSDVRNVNRREIKDMPCTLTAIGDQASKELSILSKKLMKDFKDNSKDLTINYGEHGMMTIQTFQPRLSKVIIDEIDRILSKHYDLTDEELDFIINFDFKYRMGEVYGEIK